MPGFPPPGSDRSPRPQYAETNMRKINVLKHIGAALTCGGRAYRFRAEFRPPPTSVPER
jgi:hypothetical protein